jgi:GAF domain-containing protein
LGRRSGFFPPNLIDSFIAAVQREKTLNEALNDLALYIEQNNSTPVFASILLTDKTGRHLYRAAAPSLPESYSSQIDGAEVGPETGSCGTAVFCGHPIYVVDVENDRYWTNYKALALAHGLRACWSVPIFSSTRRIVGAFAMYYSTVRSPSAEESRLIEECAETAARLIEAAEAADNNLDRSP